VSSTQKAGLSCFLAVSSLLLFLGCPERLSPGEIDTLGFYLQPGESVEDRCSEMQDICRTRRPRHLNLINVAPINPSAPAIAATSSKKVSCSKILQSSECSDIGEGGWTKPSPGPDAGARPAPGGTSAVYYSSKGSIYQTVAEDCTALKNKCTDPAVKNVEILAGNDRAKAVTLACSELLDEPYCRAVLDRLSRDEVP
jgi:hypothetical protein